MGALAAILGALLPSASIAGISLTTWISIASALSGEAPEIKKIVADLHPVFGTLVGALAQGASTTEAAWAASTHAKVIPGYAADGSVIAIPVSG